eukprot:TRINITY_DN20893_c0_g1_i2.p1 TRINITY_DN20893_c0_g1~~TRINITY_DN20893_c0_g1_i2.p1  ORF type:complete len:1408 (+),score=174.68 TRINITY_DN20893_c0_g1_i2:1138-5361(+)
MARFEQRVSVSRTIRKILLDYSNSQTEKCHIGPHNVYELLQNADDAKAQAFKLVVTKEDIFAFNDALFTPRDLRNISEIGGLVKESKEGDSTKIGKFGIGFNSCYHFTDTPAFISGNFVVAFDPLCRHLPLVDGMQVGGLMWDINQPCPDGQQSFWSQLLGDFQKFEGFEPGKPFPGTLFYFPLRKAPSDLWEHVYGQDELNIMIQSFQPHCCHALLFLKSVCQIEIQLRIEANGMVFTSRASQQLPLNDFLTMECDGLGLKQIRTLSYHDGSARSEARFAVCHQIESSSGPVKWTAVAIPLDHELQNGELFCSLPVQSSPFPVHLHGTFELSSDRQFVKEKSAWNKALCNMLAECYAGGLCYAQLIRTTEYYHSWPSPQKISGFWEALCKQTLTHLCNLAAFVTHSGPRPLSEIWFPPAELKEIVPLLNKCGLVTMTVTCDEEWETMINLQRLLKFWNAKALAQRCITPRVIRELFKSVKNQDENPSRLSFPQDIHATRLLLEFAMSDKLYDELVGVSLAVVLHERWDGPIPFGRTQLLFSKDPLLHALLHPFPVPLLAPEPDVSPLLGRPQLNVSLINLQMLAKILNEVIDEGVITEDPGICVTFTWVHRLWQILSAATNQGNRARQQVATLFLNVPVLPVIIGKKHSLVRPNAVDHYISSPSTNENLKSIVTKIANELQIPVIIPDFVKEVSMLWPHLVFDVESTGAVVRLLRKYTHQQLSTETSCEVLHFIAHHHRSLSIDDRDHLKHLAIFPQIGGGVSVLNPDPMMVDTLPPCILPLATYWDWLFEATPPVKTLAADLHITALTDIVGVYGAILTRTDFLLQRKEELLALLMPLLCDLCTHTNCTESLDGIRVLLETQEFFPTEEGALVAIRNLFDPTDELVQLLRANQCIALESLPVPAAAVAHLLPALRLFGMQLQPNDAVLLKACCGISALRDKQARKRIAELITPKILRRYTCLTDTQKAELQGAAFLCVGIPASLLPLFPPMGDTELVAPKSAVPSHCAPLLSPSKMPIPKVLGDSLEEGIEELWPRPTVDEIVRNWLSLKEKYGGIQVQPDVAEALQFVQKAVLTTLEAHCTEVPTSVSHLGKTFPFWLHGRFVPSCAVALCTPTEVPPILVRFPDCHCPNLCQAWNIAVNPPLETCLEALASASGRQLLFEEISVTVSILQVITTRYADEYKPLRPRVLVPASTGVLRPVDGLLRGEPPSPAEADRYVHADVPASVVRALQIPSLTHVRRHQEQEHYLGKAVRSFGQRSNLLGEIRGILKDYNDPMSIFLEAIQNADDAGATVVRFACDARVFTHTSEPPLMLGADMAETLTTGALLVHNNASFTEEDWQALVVLRSSRKATSDLAIGRNGIGSNVMFHLTDLPTICSRGRLLTLDPQLEYLPPYYATEASPGC